jgi:hypothetical protein
MASFRKVRNRDGSADYVLDVKENGIRICERIGSSNKKFASKVYEQIRLLMSMRRLNMNHFLPYKTTTIKQFAQEYRETYHRNKQDPGSALIDQAAIGYLEEHFGEDFLIQDISKADVNRFRSFLSQKRCEGDDTKTLTPAMVNSVFRSLKTAFYWAMIGKRMYLRYNVFAKAPEPPKYDGKSKKNQPTILEILESSKRRR